MGCYRCVGAALALPYAPGGLVGKQLVEGDGLALQLGGVGLRPGERRVKSRCANPFEIRASVRTRSRTTSTAKPKRLNPFEIRASVRTVLYTAPTNKATVLIPLKSGHQSGPSPAPLLCSRVHVLIPLKSGHQSGLGDLARHHQAPGLNPFEIRASVRTAAEALMQYITERLNPFEIRASVRTALPPKLPCRLLVLIPLKSGHQSGPKCGSSGHGGGPS